MWIRNDNPKTLTPENRKKLTDIALYRVRKALSENKDIVLVDESLFSGQDSMRKTWSPVNEHL